jgi:hypothetical protein
MTKQFLINELHRYFKEFKKSPTFREMNLAKDYPAPITFVKCFGTWNNSLREANLIIRQNRYSPEELAQWLIAFKLKYKRLPKHREITPGISQGAITAYGSIANYFKSFNKPIKNKNVSKIPSKLLIRKEINKFINKHKRNPSLLDVRKGIFTFNNFHIIMHGGILQFYSNRYPGNNIFTNYCKYIAEDGHTCYSQSEMYLDDWLHHHHVNHTREINYPKDKKLNPKNNLRCDFVIDSLWIEFSGIYGNSKYLQRLKRKQRLAKKYNIDLIILTVNDVLSNGKLNDKRLNALFVAK